MASGLADDYRLIHAAPTVEEYLELRKQWGLTPRTRKQAAVGRPGSWVASHIIYEPTGHAVAMGRVLGDGGWYFHVVDLAVLPEHQRRGLGDAVLTALLHPVTTAQAITRLRIRQGGIGLRTRAAAGATDEHDQGCGQR